MFVSRVKNTRQVPRGHVRKQHNPAQGTNVTDQEKGMRILSVSGCRGAGGLMPLFLLSQIEHITRKRTGEMFTLIGDTNNDLLTMALRDGSLSATQIVAIYSKLRGKIFPSGLRKLCYYILYGPTYDSIILEREIAMALGGSSSAHLSQPEMLDQILGKRVDLFLSLETVFPNSKTRGPANPKLGNLLSEDYYKRFVFRVDNESRLDYDQMISVAKKSMQENATSFVAVCDTLRHSSLEDQSISPHPPPQIPVPSPRGSELGARHFAVVCGILVSLTFFLMYPMNHINAMEK